MEKREALLEEALDSVKGNRDNTPSILETSAPGVKAITCKSGTLDYSHASDGYVCFTYCGSNPKTVLQIAKQGGSIYTYSIHGKDCEAFPLSEGNGIYEFTLFENISGNSYSYVMNQKIPIEIRNEFGSFLYPNQYIWYVDCPKTIAMGKALAYSANTDLDVIRNVYNYCITNISYDYSKVDSLVSGYTPNVEDTFQSKKGICLDYCAVMATMLRTQNIPTKMEVGYAGTEYHAWISVYTKEEGWIDGLIRFDGQDWSLMDPTFASTNAEDIFEKFFKDSSNYVMKYMY